MKRIWAKGRRTMPIGVVAMASLLPLTTAVRAEGAGPTPRTWTSQEQPSAGYEKVMLITDPETGCQYLFYRLGYENSKAGTTGGLTPRLDKDGRPMCGTNDAELKHLQ
ncbi:DUF6440 family protein [Azospirillum sp. sgz302134]